ncbi:MAG: flavodoxin domain-containing protein [Candidatus Cloacimonadota bacterium]|nr:flavodoxin domain-containing protein [Candidatus Cloacimonadota bacterium]
MNTAIIYMSKYGTTEKIAKIIQSKLVKDQTKIFNLKKTKSIELENYHTIIIGGSIHVGSIPKKLKQFIANNMTILLKKRIALFMICMQKGEKRDEQFTNAFPIELRKVSIANGFMGGEFCFDRMNFLERIIVKKIAGTSSNVSEIDYEAIDIFINKLKNQ